MKNDPLVSIVTPTYRHGHCLPDTIESVLAQTYPHIDYMIFDAGSQDATPQILQDYRQQGVYAEVNQGQSQSAAINAGWQRAEGDILAWLNSDDTYYPDSVQQAVDYFLKHPDAFWVYGEPTPVDEHGEPFPFRDPGEAWDYGRLLERNFITQPTVFLRREVVDDLGYVREDLDFMMDYEYWLRIGQKYPGHYVPSIRAKVTYTRSMKSSAGGFPRLKEMEDVVTQYGGKGLPASAHVEWVMAALDETLAHVSKGELGDARRFFSKLRRFPGAIPRGSVKFLLNKMLSPEIETRLRQLLVNQDRL